MWPTNVKISKNHAYILRSELEGIFMADCRVCFFHLWQLCGHEAGVRRDFLCGSILGGGGLFYCNVKRI